MKKIKMLLSAGTAAAAVAGVMALTATPAISDDKSAIEVITHAGAGGGTDVNARMMMIRTRRALKQDMVVVNKRGGGGAFPISLTRWISLTAMKCDWRIIMVLMKFISVRAREP